MSFELLNSLGAKKEPFLFISDFEANEIIVIPFDKLEENDVEYCIDENYISSPHKKELKKIQ